MVHRGSQNWNKESQQSPLFAKVVLNRRWITLNLRRGLAGVQRRQTVGRCARVDLHCLGSVGLYKPNDIGCGLIWNLQHGHMTNALVNDGFTFW